MARMFFKRRVPHAPLYAGEVHHVDAGSVGQFLLGGPLESPQRAYVPAKGRSIVVHVPLDVTLSTLRL